MSNPPTLAAFQGYVANVAGISAAYLPPASPDFQHAFDQALNLANDVLSVAPAQTTSYTVLELAVYSLGTHLLLEFTQDQVFPIAALSWAPGGTATATLVSAPATPLVAGQIVCVSGCSPLAWNTVDQNGSPINVPILNVGDPTHFDYPVPVQPPTANAFGQAAYVVFANTRAQARMGSFNQGIVSSSSDVSSSTGLATPRWAEGLTIGDLQLAKTIWGRRYLSIAQKYGPTIWGLT